MANPVAQRLAAWFATPLGATLLREERPFLTEAVRSVHGDSLLWLGTDDILGAALQGSLVRNRFHATAGDQPSAAVPSFRCEPDALPLPNHVLDALVLHHALETARDPRGVLREAARVLAPGGRLILCVFNPLSLWGIRRGYAAFVRDPFRGQRWQTPGRLLDWLALLGFDYRSGVHHLAFGLPFGRGRTGGGNPVQRFLRRVGVPMGGVCIVVATKQSFAVRPLDRARPRLRTVVYGGKPAYGRTNVIRLPVPHARAPGSE